MSTHLLPRIDHYLNTVPRAACEVVEVGPFTCFFRRSSLLPFITYARPTGELAEDATAHIGEVRAEFARRKRPCRWELIADLAPTLANLLCEGGFPPPEARPLMVLDAEALAHPESPPGVAIRRLESDSELLEASDVGRIAFDVPDALWQEVRNAFAESRSPIRSYGATADGRVVGTGSFVPLDGIAEVAGIGVLPEYRRRGIGSLLTGRMAAGALDAGCDVVFLSAADEATAEIYRRVGFRTVGTAMDTMDGGD